MMTRFGVKNYKCLGEIDIPLTPIHVLIGENDAGKTSLLEAMYALYRSSEMELSKAFAGHWTGRELVCETAPETIVDLAGDWETGGTWFTSYDLRVNFPTKENRQCQTVQEIIAKGSDIQFVLDAFLRTLHETNICSIAQHGVKCDEYTRIDVKRVASALDGVQMYRLDPALMALPSALSNAPAFRLDRDGFGLPGLLDDLLGYDPALFGKIAEIFCEFFSQFKAVRIKRETALDRIFREDGLHQARPVTGKGIFFETRNGTEIRAQQASDGAILFLGILALCHLPKPPKLLLLEEPENGIYPKRLEQVIEVLKRLISEPGETKVPQIVMTTHSPYVLSFFEPEEVTFLSRKDGVVRARPLRDAPNIKERLGNEFYLGELWYNLSEKELFGDD